jgi:hypothetical protein
VQHNIRVIDGLDLKPLKNAQDEDFHDVVAERHNEKALSS